jgi:hypothetical protein
LQTRLRDRAFASLEPGAGQVEPELEAARARGVELPLVAVPVDAFWPAAPRGFEVKSLSEGETTSILCRTSSRPRKPRRSRVRMPPSSRGEERVWRAAVGGGRPPGPRGHGPDRQLKPPLCRASRGAGAKLILELNMRHALNKTLGLPPRKHAPTTWPSHRRRCSIKPTDPRWRATEPPGSVHGAVNRLVVGAALDMERQRSRRPSITADRTRGPTAGLQIPFPLRGRRHILTLPSERHGHCDQAVIRQTLGGRTWCMEAGLGCSHWPC